MSNKTLSILGIIAAVMMVLAALQSRMARESTAPTATGSTYLIQGLDIAKVAKIVLGTGSNTVTLTRDPSNQFVITNKENYPATIREVNSLLNTCLDIKADELITSSPDNHADLEVSEEKSSKAAKFYDAQDKLITGILVGKSSGEGGGTYVRLANNNDVYLSSSSTWIRTNAADYFEKELLKVKEEDIVEVKVAAPDYAYTITNEAGKDPVLNPVPEGKKVRPAECKTVLSALANLNLTDVMKNLPSEDLKFDRSYVCQVKNSTVYTIEIAKQNEKAYIRCSAEFTDTTPVMKENREESEEELKQKEEKLLARDAADTFTKKHNGWIYELSNWQMKNLTKDLKDLVEDIPAEKPADAKPEAPEAPITGAAPAEPSSTPPAEASPEQQ
jgi:hypothetical protein